MSDTITIRLTEELATWLKSTARKTGVPVGRLVREQLERAKRETGTKSFMRFSGSIDGPPDLSSRKGFSRK
ncbi:MAG: ribbon-helix-helix domain-containing protein [Acidobacteriales bacterium]|nr:ribbon-helix-helix domain-containing protein [Candidatus Koribacter versatilis]MBI3646685.1 ribbon-helix-helix domain-containing protein [Terriglobales bacterium]